MHVPPCVCSQGRGVKVRGEGRNQEEGCFAYHWRCCCPCGDELRTFQLLARAGSLTLLTLDRMTSSILSVCQTYEQSRESGVRIRVRMHVLLFELPTLSLSREADLALLATTTATTTTTTATATTTTTTTTTVSLLELKIVWWRAPRGKEGSATDAPRWEGMYRTHMHPVCVRADGVASLPLTGNRQSRT